MLAHVLALVVGLGSFALYMAAFFFPEVHRKNDFIWSGIGLFYALVLWVCAARITGGVLLGQTASVILLGWLGWQTFTLRRQVAVPEQQTPIPSSEELQAALSELASPETLSKLPGQFNTQLAKLKTSVQTALKPKETPKSQPSAPPEAAPYVPLTPADFGPGSQSGMEPEGSVEVVSTEAVSAEPVKRAPEVMQSAPPTIAPPQMVKPVTSPTEPSAIGSAIAELPEKVMGAVTAFVKQSQAAFKGLTAKREPKPVYVRKQFRTPQADEPDAEFEDFDQDDETQLETMTAELLEADAETPIVATGQTDMVQEGTLPADSLIQAETLYEASQPEPVDSVEVVDSPKAIPPHPPTSDLVEAALADAEEKHVSASPPSTTEPES